jgi:4-amino-4-deoxy-L-arabinose transferase-like glycosyltransferase
MGEREKGGIFYFILLIVAVVPLFSLGLFNHGLWTPDEPRVAEIGREAAAGGSIAVPTLDQKPFLEEPPLYYAALAVAFKTLGVSDRTARLPSAVFAFGCVLALFFFGRLFFGPRTAFISAFIMATCGEYLRVAHWVVVDGGLACFVVLALTFFAAAYLRAGDRKRWVFYGVAYLCCALAFLTKGFIGVVLPAATACVFLVFDRNIKEMMRMRLWLGGLILLATVLPWLVALLREGGWEYLRIFLVRNHLERLLGGATGHNQPFYYYLTGFPAGFAPWAFLILPALLRAFLSRGEGKAKKGTLLAKCWFITGFVLLSAASTKRILYMMPLFAPASVLTALFIEGTLGRRALSGFERFFVLLFGLLPLVAGAAVAPFTLYASRKYGFDVSLRLIGALLLFSAAAVVLSWWALSVRARSIGRFWVLSSASIYVLLLFVLTCGFPLLDRYKTFVPFCDAVTASVPASAALYAYKPDETLRGVIPFYTGHCLREEADLPGLTAALGREKGTFVVVRDTRGTLEGELLGTGRLAVVYRDPIRSCALFKEIDLSKGR